MKQIQVQVRHSTTADEQHERAYATQADRDLARARQVRDRAKAKATR